MGEIGSLMTPLCKWFPIYPIGFQWIPNICEREDKGVQLWPYVSKTFPRLVTARTQWADDGPFLSQDIPNFSPMACAARVNICDHCATEIFHPHCLNLRKLHLPFSFSYAHYIMLKPCLACQRTARFSLSFFFLRPATFKDAWYRYTVTNKAPSAISWPNSRAKTSYHLEEETAAAETWERH